MKMMIAILFMAGIVIFLCGIYQKKLHEKTRIQAETISIQKDRIENLKLHVRLQTLSIEELINPKGSTHWNDKYKKWLSKNQQDESPDFRANSKP